MEQNLNKQLKDLGWLLHIHHALLDLLLSVQVVTFSFKVKYIDFQLHLKGPIVGNTL